MCMGNILLSCLLQWHIKSQRSTDTCARKGAWPGKSHCLDSSHAPLMQKISAKVETSAKSYFILVVKAQRQHAMLNCFYGIMLLPGCYNAGAGAITASVS